MGIRSVVFVLLAGALVLGATEPDLNINDLPDPWPLLTPKMTSANTPHTGEVTSWSTPSLKKNVGWKAFDGKKYNRVPMYCPAQADVCKPMPLAFEFEDKTVIVRDYSLYVSSRIPADQKPVNWRLYMLKSLDSFILLDNVTNFDWSHTEVYTNSVSQLAAGSKVFLFTDNALDADGSLTVTISELELHGQERKNGVKMSERMHR